MFKMNAKSLFIGESMECEVAETHKEFRDRFKDLKLSFREFMIIGHTWKHDKLVRLNDQNMLEVLAIFFKTWKYDQSDEMLSDFELYNSREIQNARKKANYLRRLAALNDLSVDHWIDQKEPMPLEMVTKLSLEAHDSPSIVYAIKMYLLANFSEEDLEDYWGILPMTGPVHKVLYRFFDLDGSQYDQTIFCHVLAQECDVTPMYINTALWLLHKL